MWSRSYATLVSAVDFVREGGRDGGLGFTFDKSIEIKRFLLSIPTRKIILFFVSMLELMLVREQHACRHAPITSHS